VAEKKPYQGDPAGSLRERLTWHYYKNFPDMTKRLEKEGKLRHFISEKAYRWSDVVAEQMQSGRLQRFQAEELADEVAFERPLNLEEQEPEQANL